jgi:hypothetical protein
MRTSLFLAQERNFVKKKNGAEFPALPADSMEKTSPAVCRLKHYSIISQD